MGIRFRARVAIAAIFFSGLACLASAIPASADSPPEIFKPFRTETPPVLDGKLDDPVWRKAPSVSGFKTFIPDFGREPSERTVAFMAYDAENLYFAFKCYDREPDKIKASMANRDTIRPDDFICINLDTFGDQQSLYALYVNPLGIQTDSRYASGQEDYSVDLVWMSAGRLDPDGYSVELSLPFKSIRYAGKARVRMSIFFERRISRRSEHSSYPELDPARGYFFLTQMMPFELRDIKRYTLLEILPAFTYVQKWDRAAGILERGKAARDLSLTGKYGITSQLILDAAWNPDFSQVEADAGQVDVNLRYDLFFPEKRPFFLEGSEMFLLAGSSGEDPLQSVVHTRTIVDPRLGFKLSGKVGSKDTIASILALDESPSLEPSWARNDRFAGFAVLRYKRAVADDGFIGGFYTGREYDSGSNQVAGADGQVRLGRSSILGFHGFSSRSRDMSDAPVVDGTAVGLDYLYDTRGFAASLGFHDVSRGFQTATGYLTRNGLTSLRATVQPRIYPKSRFFRKLTTQIYAFVLKDLYFDMIETKEALTLQALLPGNTTVTVAGAYATEIFLGRRFNTSALSIQSSSQVTKRLYLLGQYRRGNAIRYADEPYQGYGNRVVGNVIYQPSEQFKLSFNLTYVDLFQRETKDKVFDYAIGRGMVTYQMNKYLFFRTIVEYNTYRKELLTDLLASFTYIPGTVVQLGYGSLHNKVEWVEGEYSSADRFLEMKRSLFFKASFLWRL